MTDEIARRSQRVGSLDTSWLRDAGPLIAELGFSIVTGTHPGSPVATDLLVALRDQPTLRHFDPEEVSFWAPEGGRGRPRRIERDTPVPLEGVFSWGRISIADRLGLTNQWLSFGGWVRAAELDPTTTVVAFSSPAPIQRWSGHSQGLDLLTPEMGAFFGRLMIPIDFEPGAEARIAGTPPTVLYCAFIEDVDARVRRSQPFREADSGLVAFVEREVQRLSTTDPADWQAGADLLAELGVRPPA